MEGYANLDRKDDQEVYPLAYSGIDEIRASHVLEHFEHNLIQSVVDDWVKALKPGGVLKVAVPDFEIIAQQYLGGTQINVQGFLMGGQEDENDFHKAVFDRSELVDVLSKAGLVNIRPWESDQQDCASLPISLNLRGTKPKDIDFKSMKVGATMSVPRLGFMDNFFCAFTALMPLGIRLSKHTGAFWGQCLERAIDEWLKTDVDYILTIDYDTIYTRRHVEDLLRLAHEHPEADAIAPLQASRTKSTPLLTIKRDGKNQAEIPRSDFEKDLLQINTAHFGLTLIRADKLRAMPRPLFKSIPGDDGRWDESRTDDDIYFWRQWEKQGNTLYSANRVAVGHAELMIRWPDSNMQATYQHPSEFYKIGEPGNIWA